MPRSSLLLGSGTWRLTHVFSPRVSVPLLKTLDQMLANGCFAIFTAEEK